MFPVDSKLAACWGTEKGGGGRGSVLKRCQCFPDLCGLCGGKTDAGIGLRCVFWLCVCVCSCTATMESNHMHYMYIQVQFQGTCIRIWPKYFNVYATWTWSFTWWKRRKCFWEQWGRELERDIPTLSRFSTLRNLQIMLWSLCFWKLKKCSDADPPHTTSEKFPDLSSCPTSKSMLLVNQIKTVPLKFSGCFI